MSAACLFPAKRDTLVRDLLGYVDCQIGETVRGAYGTLLGPGGALGGWLTTALTILIALFAIQLILGRSRLSLPEVVPLFLKIGIVVALVTSWASYQVLIYDLLFKGPEQIANLLLGQAGAGFRALNDGAPLASTDLYARLQVIFDRMAAFASQLWGMRPAGVAGQRLGGAQFLSLALWTCALLLMLVTVGLLLVARVLLGVLLALGPVFICLALFRATRGLFEGWARLALRFALVPLFVLLLTAVLVAVLPPLVANLRLGDAGQVDAGPTIAIALVLGVFAIILVQALGVAKGIAAGLKLPQWTRTGEAPAVLPAAGTALAPAAPLASDRAQLLAQAVGRAERLSGRAAPAAEPAGGSDRARIITVGGSGSSWTAAATPLGQSYRRLAVAQRAKRIA
jgi:type IV secretion system protein VirB6